MSTTRDSALPRRAGYVLTGGRSSRFGSNKAFADVDGMPMAAHVARSVLAAADSVALVGSPETYGSLGFRTVRDGVDNFGPVAGILAALEDSAAPHTLVVACDMPNLRGEFLERLFRRAESSRADVVMPLSMDGREQPLCSVFAAGAVEAVRRAVETGTAKVMDALGGLSTAYLLPPEYADLDPSGEMLLNVNSPGDFARRR